LNFFIHIIDISIIDYSLITKTMQTRIRQSLLFGISMVSLSACTAQEQKEKAVSESEMHVSWHYQKARIYFEMRAPTDGWVTIGFNTTNNMTGAYLLMGRVKNDEAEIVEHFTISQGNYKPVQALGAQTKVNHVEGVQKEKNTLLKFSLPVEANSEYQKNLSEGKKYVMILAYSLADDFQHHSIMRTSINVEL